MRFCFKKLHHTDQKVSISLFGIIYCVFLFSPLSFAGPPKVEQMIEVLEEKFSPEKREKFIQRSQFLISNITFHENERTLRCDLKTLDGVELSKYEIIQFDEQTYPQCRGHNTAEWFKEFFEETSERYRIVIPSLSHSDLKGKRPQNRRPPQVKIFTRDSMSPRKLFKLVFRPRLNQLEPKKENLKKGDSNKLSKNLKNKVKIINDNLSFYPESSSCGWVLTRLGSWGRSGIYFVFRHPPSDHPSCLRSVEHMTPNFRSYFKNDYDLIQAFPRDVRKDEVFFGIESRIRNRDRLVDVLKNLDFPVKFKFRFLTEIMLATRCDDAKTRSLVNLICSGFEVRNGKWIHLLDFVSYVDRKNELKNGNYRLGRMYMKAFDWCFGKGIYSEKVASSSRDVSPVPQVLQAESMGIDLDAEKRALREAENLVRLVEESPELLPYEETPPSIEDEAEEYSGSVPNEDPPTYESLFQELSTLSVEEAEFVGPNQVFISLDEELSSERL